MALGACARTASAAAAAHGMVHARKTLPRRSTRLPKGELLLRGDSVAFPPGGCAYLHRHQGPGTRCVFEGAIRIDTHGKSTSYGPGGAWYETGPDPVFAQAAADKPTRFIRVMILPRALHRQKLDRICQRRGQGEAEVAELQALCRHADRFGRRVN